MHCLSCGPPGFVRTHLKPGAQFASFLQSSPYSPPPEQQSGQGHSSNREHAPFRSQTGMSSGPQGQSWEQVKQCSKMSHVPLPQEVLHAPQSATQVLHDSPSSHWPLPQVVGHSPQSSEHDMQDSPLSQTLLPHGGHEPQSAAQLKQASPELQVPLPQLGQAPQSAAQLEHVSPADPSQ